MLLGDFLLKEQGQKSRQCIIQT